MKHQQIPETRDELEVAGYAELMDLVFSSWRETRFNENHARQLHQILLRHSEKDARHRGQYKSNSNSNSVTALTKTATTTFPWHFVVRSPAI